MLGEKISPVFLPGKAASLIMTWVLLLYGSGGQAAGPAFPPQQSSVVPQQGYAPPGYNPATAGVRIRSQPPGTISTDPLKKTTEGRPHPTKSSTSLRNTIWEPVLEE